THHKKPPAWQGAFGLQVICGFRFSLHRIKQVAAVDRQRCAGQAARDTMCAAEELISSIREGTHGHANFVCAGSEPQLLVISGALAGLREERIFCRPSPLEKTIVQAKRVFVFSKD
ncbi:hypothetical protein, partial [Mitsuokella jalaludinii]|uniref:hypothetical protein n=1 Tax=Mitsuokella jalaludinii TaxID=187979 RepID=UPI002A92050A